MDDPEEDIAFFDVKHRYKNMLKFLGTIIQTLTPGSYYRLARMHARRGWHYYFQLVSFAFFLMLIFAIPALVKLPDKLAHEATKVTTLTIIPDVEVDETVSFNNDRILIANDKPYEGEMLLITKDAIYIQKLVCFLSKVGCLFTDKPTPVDAQNARAFVDNKQQLSSLLFMGFLVILPGLLLFYYLFLLLKYALIIVTIAFICFVVCLFLKNHLRWKEILLTSLYASTLFVLPEIALSPYLRLYHLPFVAYIAMMVACIAFLGEKHHHA